MARKCGIFSSDFLESVGSCACPRFLPARLDFQLATILASRWNLALGVGSIRWIRACRMIDSGHSPGLPASLVLGESSGLLNCSFLNALSSFARIAHLVHSGCAPSQQGSFSSIFPAETPFQCSMHCLSETKLVARSLSFEFATPVSPAMHLLVRFLMIVILLSVPVLAQDKQAEATKTVDGKAAKAEKTEPADPPKAKQAG